MSLRGGRNINGGYRKVNIVEENNVWAVCLLVSRDVVLGTEAC